MLELINTAGGIIPVIADVISQTVMTNNCTKSYQYITDNNRCNNFKFDTDLDFKNKRFRMTIEYNSYPVNME